MGRIEKQAGQVIADATPPDVCPYCASRAKDPNSSAEEGVPDGFCGLCEICGAPGHISQHPCSVPYTGCWCELHYSRLAWVFPLTHPLSVDGMVAYIVLGLVCLLGWTVLQPKPETKKQQAQPGATSSQSIRQRYHESLDRKVEWRESPAVVRGTSLALS